MSWLLWLRRQRATGAPGQYQSPPARYRWTCACGAHDRGGSTYCYGAESLAMRHWLGRGQPHPLPTVSDGRTEWTVSKDPSEWGKHR
jgi:hypothetical protein